MFLHRSLPWPSPPSFLLKLLRSSPPPPPPDPHDPPEKRSPWTFPTIPLPPLPPLPPLRSLLSWKGESPTTSSAPSNIDAQHFQICFNLVRHIFDVCTLLCLWLCSPIFRVALDVFGLQGAVKLWIHGLAVFVATTYGVYLLLWLAQEYLLQLVALYGILQTLVLAISLKRG
ncbi:hypothetical protein FKM82_018095 [Ascaphus truei]